MVDQHVGFAHGALTRAIIEGFLQTHAELGSGFSERVCRDALAIVLREKGLGVWVNAQIDVIFHGQNIGRFYADMVVDATVLLEIKAGQALEGYAQAQLLNYLKAAGGGVGRPRVSGILCVRHSMRRAYAAPETTEPGA